MGCGKWLLLFVLTAFLLSAIPGHSMTGNVELISPVNESRTNQTNDTVNFIFRYTDPVNATATCGLFVNNPGQAKATVSASNFTQETVKADADFIVGYNEWWVTCTNGSSVTSPTRAFFSDRNPPSINLVSPANQSVLQPGMIDFIFDLSDIDSPSAYCNLYVDGTTTGGSVVNGTQDLRAKQLGVGNFSWNVSCIDSVGNSGSSGSYILDIWSAFGLSMTSPGNVTYDRLNSIPLDFIVTGTSQWIGYSLDGGANVTVTGNTTFGLGAEGQHKMELYANDTTGNTAYDSALFTIDVSQGITFLSPVDGVYNTSVVGVDITTDSNASWCGMSLDGGANVSMTNVTAKSWFHNLTGLSEDVHDVRVWCNDSTGSFMTNSTPFSVVTSGFGISLISPLNKTYWDNAELYFLVTLGRNASGCEYSLDSAAPTQMLSSGPRTWYYNLTQIGSGSFVFSVTCRDLTGFSDSASLSFTVNTSQCSSDTEGLCSGTQECVNGACADLNCSGCYYASNHVCTAHECCLDVDCLAAQECIGNTCVDIQCPCGVIQDSVCVSYECCTNFDCPTNHECNLTGHVCVKRSISVDVTKSISPGEKFTVTVTNQDGDPVVGAGIEIEFASGANRTLTTDEDGRVTVTASESGKLKITVTMVGYDSLTISRDVSAGFDWLVVLIVLMVILGIVALFLYWKQMPAISLGKEVNGQLVTLKVKNRSGEQLDNVLIVDSVPTGAFMTCNVNPRIESYGSEDHITWFASLNPGEEIAITYQAMRTSGTFLVKVGDEEYHSGYGFTSVIKELFEKIMNILPKREKKTAVQAPPPTPQA